MIVRIEFEVEKIDVTFDIVSDIERFLQNTDVIDHMSNAEVLIYDKT